MKYFSMFSGIGGFELGIQYGLQRNLGVEPTDEESRQTEPEIQQRGERSTVEEGHSVLPRNEWSRPICIGYSEIDKYAIQIYERHFNHKNYGDATKINAAELPDFDLLVGGFPCQAFSIAGKRMGLSDTRGTLFYDIARIAEEKKPQHLLLENVKGLLSHDSGRTFKLIISTFAELGYNMEWQVLNSKNFGVPQNRERVFIIGHRNCGSHNVFPLKIYEPPRNENLFWLSEGLTKNATELLLLLSQESRENLSKFEMQTLFKRLRQEVSEGKSRLIQEEPQEIRQQPIRNLQEIEAIHQGTQGGDNSGGICEVVQLPTTDMLLLWDNPGTNEAEQGFLQRQDKSNDNRQTGLLQALRDGKLRTLLLAVQPYKEQLFYSLGDGTNWQLIYKKKVEQCNNTLSSILEDQVDDKYFLSEKATRNMLKDSSNSTLQSFLPTEFIAKTESVQT